MSEKLPKAHDAANDDDHRRSLFVAIGYKSGILPGLALYAMGASLFSASLYREFYFFLAALCVLTCGLALLEVSESLHFIHGASCHRYAQVESSPILYNPMGSLTGMFIAATVILSKLQVETFRNEERSAHPEYQDMMPAIVAGKIAQVQIDVRYFY